jgi:hypothetical protein
LSLASAGNHALLRVLCAPWKRKTPGKKRTVTSLAPFFFLKFFFLGATVAAREAVTKPLLLDGTARFQADYR